MPNPIAASPLLLAFTEHLDLRHVVMLVQDWGGFHRCAAADDADTARDVPMRSTVKLL